MERSPIIRPDDLRYVLAMRLLKFRPELSPDQVIEGAKKLEVFIAGSAQQTERPRELTPDWTVAFPPVHDFDADGRIIRSPAGDQKPVVDREIAPEPPTPTPVPPQPAAPGNDPF